jgi:histidyl-tRNA synthetase
MLLPENVIRKATDDVAIYVAGFGTQGAIAGLTVLEELRLAGLQAVSDFRSVTLKAHLRQADRLGCRFTLIIGDDEAIKGSGILRDMETKVQHGVSLSTGAIQILSLLHGS